LRELYTDEVAAVFLPRSPQKKGLLQKTNRQGKKVKSQHIIECALLHTTVSTGLEEGEKNG
jgi:hypothetical protein